ncbi:ribosomal-protein-serine acetyltransferase [Fibrobacter sp. UWH9]|uniref:GNAT family N-acetyltransferase n=1 Tax=unclassified Fibrobacter TaxID=2634177 RepID=UPI000921DAFA|nr:MULTISPECIES: GNAT family protein [unclassified Fibrobacter]MCQ2101240.1 GNAT family N-acetyltransferase [Fibrobacter sp.]MDO4947788.1 GNAT family protein [Fibrobacter sp.]SHH57056.1 ribosomal-protein-serine acetyltransferase [Fibrobacter sp. UWH9]SHL13776.1 ribosomal-protein-serine acetyltransferase [Fibrobacter sp. UWH5]
MDSFEEHFSEVFETANLKGARVTLVGLRELDEAASDALYQKICGSREFLLEHLPWIAETSPADLRKRARSWCLQAHLSQGGCWQIFETAEGGSNSIANVAENSVGNLAGFLMMDVNMGNHSATLSYWLFREFTGRGLMTESLECLCRFALDTLRLNRLELFSSVENPKSQGVARRCGFREEGICRDFELKNGIFVDHVRFSRLARDG